MHNQEKFCENRKDVYSNKYGVNQQWILSSYNAKRSSFSKEYLDAYFFCLCVSCTVITVYNFSLVFKTARAISVGAIEPEFCLL